MPVVSPAVLMASIMVSAKESLLIGGSLGLSAMTGFLVLAGQSCRISMWRRPGRTSRIAVDHLLCPRRYHGTGLVGRHQFDRVDPRRQIEHLPTAGPERETAVHGLPAAGRGLAHLAARIKKFAFELGNLGFDGR